MFFNSVSPSQGNLIFSIHERRTRNEYRFIISKNAEFNRNHTDHRRMMLQHLEVIKLKTAISCDMAVFESRQGERIL
jgi:hypothetical protein